LREWPGFGIMLAASQKNLGEVPKNRGKNPHAVPKRFCEYGLT
jgi:hypothetical protein